MGHLLREFYGQLLEVRARTPESRLRDVCRSRIKFWKFGLRYVFIRIRLGKFLVRVRTRVSLAAAHFFFFFFSISLMSPKKVEYLIQFRAKNWYFSWKLLVLWVTSTLEQLFYAPNRSGPYILPMVNLVNLAGDPRDFEQAKWISTGQIYSTDPCSNAILLWHHIRYTHQLPK